MGFFAEFDAWLTAILSGYIADNLAALAGLLEPAIVTLGVFYVVVWGYLHLMGRIEEPFLEGVKRLVTLGVILGLSLQLWLYNGLIVDTFFRAPSELAAGIIAARDPGAPGFALVDLVDEIFYDGDDAATLLLEKGELFGEDIVYYLAAVAVYVVVGLTTVYTMFLLALSRIALAVLLALGPVFFALLLFDTSRRFFEAWLAQLSNYAFLAILTVLVAALMLDVISTAAEAAVAVGGGIGIAHALKVCAAAGLTFLIMRQVPAMSQGLASGIALSSFGAVVNLVRVSVGGLKFGGRHGGAFMRGAFLDKDTSRWDSLSRKAGQRLIGARLVREKRPRRNTLSYQ
ncbi:MAG: type IV secretion system protein [Steroidobacteraceae bacterium]|jgi:type IV secretion system protein VirB6|nr:type IV secretion system protein [Steroidobacteraceae bacterium]